MRALSMLAALALSAPALAQSAVSFDVDPDLAASIGFDPSEVEAELETNLSERLRLVDADRFAASMAEAAAIAGKGIGVDYATNPTKFAVGASFSTGVNASGIQLTRDPSSLPAAGFAFQASAMAAVNLGLLAGTAGDDEFGFWDRFVVSAHGLTFTSPAGQRVFQGWMANVGGHVTVKLIGRGSKGALEWGGLDLTSGYERSMYRLSLAGDTPFRRDVSGGEITWDARGTFDLAAAVDSVPLELSTNLRVSVITWFVGAGGDLNVGRAEIDGGLSGPISASGGGGAGEIGTGSITHAARGEADPIAIRGFTGVQVNIMPVKLYGMIQASSRTSLALQAGLRVAM